MPYPIHPSNNIVLKNCIVYLRTRVGSEDVWYAYDSNKSPIGEGAMGIVYKGWRTDTREFVAIKQVNPQFADIPSIRQRARMEASMIFNHQNVVEMLGVCEWEHNRGPMFIISSWVTGTTIDEFVRNGNLRHQPHAAQRICETLFPVFDALNFLHKHGIIHMDVKPSNIMIERGYNTRLMDLGIVHTNDSVAVTSPGIIGTPKYAAPEQVIKPGDSCLQIDKTTDIYQLGVTIYELIAGVNPYNAPTINQVIQRHQTVVLPPIAGVSKHVMEVLLKATSLRQTDRYQTVMSFKSALQAAVNRNDNFFSRVRNWVFGTSR